jgi:hypothetical protein
METMRRQAISKISGLLGRLAGSKTRPTHDCLCYHPRRSRGMGGARRRLCHCVKQETVEKWLATSTEGRFLIDRVKANLGVVFGRPDCLPMEDFASAFLTLLQKYQA